MPFALDPSGECVLRVDAGVGVVGVCLDGGEGLEEAGDVVGGEEGEDVVEGVGYFGGGGSCEGAVEDVDVVGTQHGALSHAFQQALDFQQ